MATLIDARGGVSDAPIARFKLMRLIVAIVVVVLPTAILAQDIHQKLSVDTTIERGLGFVTKDALAWKNEHNCVSCHHAALVIWSMREAKHSGHVVDDAVLAELTRWVAQSGDGKF